ncbi:MAG: tRNA preQ1(34) S-adenosylmethionine ribosyltransferase-isomerase QueA [candidate division Zixibacteria bacterium]|nr:tRNA preQ1(34) S-adenosylmethionine ribosyltransferase-isomerase QueA [candidate division Zixibacteria bacterium]
MLSSFSMDINLFDYNLPSELIAQYPPEKRGDSKLMILNRSTGQMQIRPFSALPEYLVRGDALVMNNTRVFKARLLGHRQSGAEVEVFLSKLLEQTIGDFKNRLRRWEGLARPSRRLKENEEIIFDDRHRLCLRKNLGDGRWLIEFSSRTMEQNVIRKFGHVPLPQYIKRQDENSDSKRYQTVFARKDKAAAVAAPTAGLHFTRSMLDNLKQQGVKTVEVTLDVGPGTFKPVKVNDINRHVVDAEFAFLSAKVCKSLNSVKANGKRVIVVGTTSMRTLESASLASNKIEPFSKDVDLYIKPGYRFKFTDCLLTNFHLPKSSLLILVSAFAGRERILKAYQEAIRNKMRFYSYGDAMLIL